MLNKDVDHKFIRVYLIVTEAAARGTFATTTGTPVRPIRRGLYKHDLHCFPELDKVFPIT